MNWKDIQPLTESEALKIVLDYFSNHNLNSKRIETLGIPEGQRSPDIVGVQGRKNTFICEVKTPSHIFNEEKGLYVWSTTFNKLRSRIHTAIKQFSDFDKHHTIPRIVAFTSNHPQLNWTHLQHNILGAVKYGNKILQDFNSKTFVVDTNNDIQAVDIFLWFQINYLNRNSIVELAIYQNTNSKLHSDLERIVLKLVPRKEEGIQAPDILRLTSHKVSKKNYQQKKRNLF